MWRSKHGEDSYGLSCNMPQAMTQNHQMDICYSIRLRLRMSTWGHIQGDSPSMLTPFFSIKLLFKMWYLEFLNILKYLIFEFLRFFVLLKSDLWRYKLVFFKWDFPFSTINYTGYNFSGNFDISESKFVLVVFSKDIGFIIHGGYLKILVIWLMSTLLISQISLNTSFKITTLLYLCKKIFKDYYP